MKHCRAAVLLLLIFSVSCAQQSVTVRHVALPAIPWKTLSVVGTLQRAGWPSMPFAARFHPPATIHVELIEPVLGSVGALDLQGRKLTWTAPNGRRTGGTVTTARMKKILGLAVLPEQLLAIFSGVIVPELSARVTIPEWQTVQSFRLPRQIIFHDADHTTTVRLNECDVVKK